MLKYKYEMGAGAGANIAWVEASAFTELETAKPAVGSLGTIENDINSLYVYDGASWLFVDKPAIRSGDQQEVDGIYPITLLAANKMMLPALERIKNIEVAIAGGDLGWQQLTTLIRNGDAPKFFQPGGLLKYKKGAADVYLRIADIGNATKYVTANGNAPLDTSYFTRYPKATPFYAEHLRVLNGVQFSSVQANYRIETTIPAGTYKITLETSDIASAEYHFTTATELVKNGTLRLETAVLMQYRATPKSAAVNIVLAASGAGVALPGGSLSVQNHKDRVKYGNNNDEQSAARQVINSGGAKGTIWLPQSIYDIAPTWESSLDGFLKDVDPAFLAAVGQTVRQTEKNTVTDGGGNVSLNDKFFLPSRMEIFGEKENVDHKGKQLDYYIGANDAKRIKLDNVDGVTPRIWWLRSPSAGGSYIVRDVHSSGASNSYGAYQGVGVAPACVIM